MKVLIYLIFPSSAPASSQALLEGTPAQESLFSNIFQLFNGGKVSSHKLEDDLNLLDKGRQPQFLANGRRPNFFEMKDDIKYFLQSASIYTHPHQVSQVETERDTAQPKLVLF
jgi:hypothetical protein